jgi:hypothetical protein
MFMSVDGRTSVFLVEVLAICQISRQDFFLASPYGILSYLLPNEAGRDRFALNHSKPLPF